MYSNTGMNARLSSADLEAVARVHTSLNSLPAPPPFATHLTVVTQRITAMRSTTIPPAHVNWRRQRSRIAGFPSFSIPLVLANREFTR
ncbi:hypothetical protein PIN31115_04464 [Pandoraea iniqua]|uniref:Uncharacterized protein n=1 Tax=Pandoraea iniqua TaxID=2508288 RepID=A0A5E4YFB0_9BURK|nr:hypothetical protein PIN31115_04464 [Pandoraea iniqua]